jgi:hypothetical protein
MKKSMPLPAGKSGRIHWPVLLIGMAITLVVSLSFHVVMLQVLHVPYPDSSGVSRWAASVNTAFSIFATMVFYQLARLRMERISVVRQCLVVFALYAMLKETTRIMVMMSIFTTAWRYQLLAGIPGLLYYLLAGSMIVVAGRSLRGWWMKAAGAVGIAGILIFAVNPWMTRLAAPLLHAIASLDHAEVYTFPYGWKVLVPAYATFAEPTVACMLVAVLVWRRLSATPMLRMVQFVLLIMLMMGRLLPTLLFSFYLKLPLPKAVLSESQFFLEAFALAFLTAVVWQLAKRAEPAGEESEVLATR